MTPTMMAWKYERSSSKMIKVSKDGKFAGWLELSTRRTTGLHSARVGTWSGKVAGRMINEATITAAKAAVEYEPKDRL